MKYLILLILSLYCWAGHAQSTSDTTNQWVHYISLSDYTNERVSLWNAIYVYNGMNPLDGNRGEFRQLVTQFVIECNGAGYSTPSYWIGNNAVNNGNILNYMVWMGNDGVVVDSFLLGFDNIVQQSPDTLIEEYIDPDENQGMPPPMPTLLCDKGKEELHLIQFYVDTIEELRNDTIFMIKSLWNRDAMFRLDCHVIGFYLVQHEPLKAKVGLTPGLILKRALAAIKPPLNELSME